MEDWKAERFKVCGAGRHDEVPDSGASESSRVWSSARSSQAVTSNDEKPKECNATKH